MISVIIPAYNEELAVRPCLESLVAQVTKQPFEVVFVDNNSTDKTVQVVSEYANKLNLKIVHEKTQGRGAARATGFDNATGNILFSSDADTIFFPEWIELFSSFFKDPKVIAVTGSAYVNDLGPVKNWIFNLTHPWIMTIYMLLFRHYWLSGFSFAIRRDVYEKVGGLNRKLNAIDDIDLGFRVYKLGKIQPVFKPRVIMSGRRFQKNFIGGYFDYIMPFVKLVFLKNTSYMVSDTR